MTWFANPSHVVMSIAANATPPADASTYTNNHLVNSRASLPPCSAIAIFAPPTSTEPTASAAVSGSNSLCIQAAVPVALPEESISVGVGVFIHTVASHSIALVKDPNTACANTVMIPAAAELATPPSRFPTVEKTSPKMFAATITTPATARNPPTTHQRPSY